MLRRETYERTTYQNQTEWYDDAILLMEASRDSFAYSRANANARAHVMRTRSCSKY